MKLRRVLYVFAFVMFAAVVSSLVSKCGAYRAPFKVLPPGLYASKILYQNERAEGFGPGSNETGLIVFELPEETAKKIEAGGLSFLQQLYHYEPSQYQHQDHQWRVTPLNWDCRVQGTESEKGDCRPEKLNDTLNQYGSLISVDPGLENEIDRALAISGNYYKGTHYGVLLINVSGRRAYFYYSG